MKRFSPFFLAVLAALIFAAPAAAESPYRDVYRNTRSVRRAPRR